MRLYDARGRLLFERTITDTAVSVTRGTTLRAGGAAYWDIVALDSLRQVIACSGAVRATSGGAAAPPLP